MSSFLDTEKFMDALGGAIDDVLKEKCHKRMGFALFVFEFNEPGITNYISNAERESMIEALKETIERLENNEDIPTPVGGVQ